MPDVLTEDMVALQAEQNEIMREQARGEWKVWGELTDDVKKRFADSTAHDAWVQKRIHRGIEIVMLLRRSNTGPAKPGSKRGPKGKTPINLDALNEDILA